MTIDNFFATQITGQGHPAVKTGALTGKPAVMPLHGLAFFDQFLADAEKALDLKLGTIPTQQAAPPQDNQPQVSGLLSEDTNTNILEALANSEFTMKELGKIENPQLSDVMALNQQVTDEELLQIKIPGTQEISSVLESVAITSEPNFRAALSNLQRVLQKIETLMKRESPALIGTNVTPEQITELQQKVDDLLQGISKDGKTESEEFAGIFAGLIHILPPQAKPDAVIQGVGPVMILSAPPAPVTAPSGPQDANPTDDLAAKLNDLVVGGREENADTPEFETGDQAKQKSQEATLQNSAQNTPAQKSIQPLADMLLKTPPEKQSLPDPLRNLTNLESSSAEDAAMDIKPGIENLKNGTAQSVPHHGKPQASLTTPDLSVLKPALTSLPGMSDMSSGGIYATSAVAGSEYGIHQYSSFSPMGQGAASSLLSQAPQAALPHPGTQMVAATLQRAGSSGEDSRITLQLDPPELGRVEIKMSFEKNSKIKAVLTAEKAETYSMLQRDAGILERALQGAGLDTDGGLSFELAQEGYTFGQDEGRGGSGQNGHGTTAKADGSQDILQTTMSWAVDPDTGHMHYNILA